MAGASLAPFVVALVVTLALFAGLTVLLVRDEARQRVRSPSTVAPPRVDATPVVARPSHPRVAAIGMLFTLWSVWATARRVSRWR